MNTASDAITDCSKEPLYIERGESDKKFIAKVQALYDEHKSHKRSMPPSCPDCIKEERNWRFGEADDVPEPQRFRGQGGDDVESRFNYESPTWNGFDGVSHDYVLGWFSAQLPLTIIVKISEWTNDTVRTCRDENDDSAAFTSFFTPNEVMALICASLAGAYFHPSNRSRLWFCS